METLIAVFLTIAGFLMRFIAIRTLGNAFSFKLQRPPRLVTSGIYRAVRHPTYTASIIATIGLVWLASNVWLGLIMGWIGFGIAHERAEREEQMLLFWFGFEYEDYMKQTKMLIPFIY